MDIKNSLDTFSSSEVFQTTTMQRGLSMRDGNSYDAPGDS